MNEGIFRRWWTKLLDHARNRLALHSNNSPSDGQWVRAASCVSGVGFCYSVTKHAADVELQIDRPSSEENKRIFDHLHASKAQVESNFGGPLLWNRLDQAQHSRIGISLVGGYADPEAQWDRIHEEMVDAMIRLQKALDPHLAELAGDTPMSQVVGLTCGTQARKTTPAYNRHARKTNEDGLTDKDLVVRHVLSGNYGASVRAIKDALFADRAPTATPSDSTIKFWASMRAGIPKMTRELARSDKRFAAFFDPTSGTYIRDETQWKPIVPAVQAALAAKSVETMTPVALTSEPELAPPSVVRGQTLPIRPLNVAHLKDDEPRESGASKPVKKPRVPAIVDWVERLLASQTYKRRKDSVRRHPPDDDIVRRCLVALDSTGGIMTPVAFCEATDLPAARLDGLMAHVQRLLNVDGYDVLVFSRAENRIEINVAKLKRQFDLE
jgi:hypothetical protein